MRKFTTKPSKVTAATEDPLSAKILQMLNDAGIDTKKHTYIMRSVDSDGYVSEFRFYAPGNWIALWATLIEDTPTFKNIVAQCNGPDECELSIKWYIEKYPTVDKFRFSPYVQKWSTEEGSKVFELFNYDTDEYLIADFYFDESSEYGW